MRSAILLIAIIAVASAMNIARPRPLNLKLAEQRRELGASLADKSFVETYEHLSVAAAERESSLADKFAVDLAAHVAAKEEAEATAGMEETEAETETEEAAESEGITSELAIEANGASEGELSFESLQSLEFFESVERAVNAKPKTLDRAMGWKNCQSVSMTVRDKVGVTVLQNVALRANPPVRTSSFAIEIDGTYTGPDVTYGSVTLQIKRVKTNELTLNKSTKRTEKPPTNSPALIYRHSIVLSDVLTGLPLRSTKDVSATLFIPTEAFNLYAASGDYVLTAVFTNQNKLPFACAAVNFSLQ
jgi:hypothetical protein